MNSDSESRPYRKAERARQEQETRLRITEAAVEMHRTVGPANTTMTEVAELAGVSRATVNFAAGEASVVFDPGRQDAADLIAAVEALGYGAKEPPGIR